MNDPVQRMMANELHAISDCIHSGNVVDICDLLEEMPVENMTTCGQVLVQFLQFHIEQMAMLEQIKKGNM